MVIIEAEREWDANVAASGRSSLSDRFVNDSVQLVSNGQRLSTGFGF